MRLNIITFLSLSRISITNKKKSLVIIKKRTLNEFMEEGTHVVTMNTIKINIFCIDLPY